MLAEGDDLLIIAAGSMVVPSLEAAAILRSEGILAGVMNARFLKPLDRELIVAKCAATGKVLTVEEGILAGGFGGSILELLADEGLEGLKVIRMGISDTFVEHGTRGELLAEFGLDAEGIAARARSLVEGRSDVGLAAVSYGRRLHH
jgi:1-deoxy-D-xylulose-5-phosphate synthase